MTVRIQLYGEHGEWLGRLGTVERISASGGLWVRPAEWPPGVADELGGLMFFDPSDVEEVAACAAA